jgi:hypothetical protein
MTEQCDTSVTDIAVRRGKQGRTRPRKPAGEIAADYKTRKEVDTRRKAFIPKWRVKCEALQPAARRRAIGSLPSRGYRLSHGTALVTSPSTPYSQ